MKVLIYQGGMKIVAKSGVGKAVLHQKEALNQFGTKVVTSMKDNYDIMHINTVFPDSVIAAIIAKMSGKKVVYYGHSTMEDFRNSFHLSNMLAPLFKRWIKFCYSLGDVIVTPTDYSKKLLKSYGIKKPIYHLTNGIDTDFFAEDKNLRKSFREKYNIPQDEKVVISVGHYIDRKGIIEFVEAARKMPEVHFIWFGYTNLNLIPQNVKKAIENATDNVEFPGYVSREELKEAYCGADLFAFLSKEETEGIVVLEALACGIPTILRDIPVYGSWLEDGKNVYKIFDEEEPEELIEQVLYHKLPDVSKEGHNVAESRSLKSVGESLNKIYLKEGLVNLAKEERLRMKVKGGILLSK